MIRKTKTKGGKVRYGVRVHTGGGNFEWLGTYPTREKARDVEAKWRLSRQAARTRSCGEFADFWLEGYAARVKASSADTARSAITAFKQTFATRSLASIDETEAETWARQNRWAVPAVVTMLNDATDKRLLERNPFRGLSRKGPGRKHLKPLSVAEVDELAAIAGRIHGETMRAFVLFTAYTGMRVGEVFALEWGDVDLDRNRIAVKRRVYRGELDLPKANRTREIVLIPEARDALLALDRSGALIFPAKRGGRMSQSGLAYYWQAITGAFGRKVTPHELRHFAGHHLFATLGMRDVLVAAQLGHADGGKLVRDLYGHGDVGALEEIDRHLASNVVPLRRKASGE